MQMKAAMAEIPGRRLNVPAMPVVSRSVQAAAGIEDPGVTVVERKPDDLDQIAARLSEAFGANESPRRRDLNQAAWCIWEGKRPLAEQPSVLTKLLDHVRGSGRKSSFRRLASVYVTAFRPLGTSANDASLRQVARTLEAIAPAFTGPFSVAAEALRLFDPREAPRVIAGRALQMGSSPSTVLAGVGIQNMASEGGLAEAAFLAGLEQLAADATLSPTERLARISGWGLRGDGKVLFEQHRGPLVDALVMPHGDNPPAKDVIDQYLRFLVGKFGDPRLRQANWSPMRSTATVRRWLTSLSLRQFLDVVDRGAYVAQWRYRRAFWEAVHRRDLISDAWVVFDEVGDDAARRLFKVEAPYARFEAGGRKPIERGHAVLLLKIGKGIVAEWSHNGRCNVWHSATDPSAPQLHQRRYNTDETRISLKSTPEFLRIEITHAGSEGYNWQAKVANEIHALTNIRILESEYRLY
ncbi:hypothetical protein FV222_00775 [Methylobacterium sp. WL103]|nr:hypothetical protein FV222_00775 [Methylobacterium sp. WL103]